MALVLEAISESSIDDFDKIIGHIEDIVISDEFQEIHHDFLDRNYHHFEVSDENKIIYTNIFNEYTGTIENFIVDELNRMIENFDMEKFVGTLE